VTARHHSAERNLDQWQRRLIRRTCDASDELDGDNLVQSAMMGSVDRSVRSRLDKVEFAAIWANLQQNEAHLFGIKFTV
jgi:hypothetical protein